MHTVAKLQTVNRIPGRAGDAQNRLGEHRNVQCVELLAVLGKIEGLRLAICADDDVAAPRREVECHPHCLPATADDHDLLSPRLVAVAVGADVRARAEGVRQSGNVRPDVADADSEEEPSGAQLFP